MYCSKQNPMITSPQKHSQSKLFKLMPASSVCVQHPSIITELYQHEHEQIAPQVPHHPTQRLLNACFGWVWTSHTNSHTLKQTCTCVARGNPLFCDLLLINFDYRPGDLICLIWHVCVCVCVCWRKDANLIISPAHCCVKLCVGHQNTCAYGKGEHVGGVEREISNSIGTRGESSRSVFGCDCKFLLIC